MNIHNAIDQLVAWCNESRGVPIEVVQGTLLSFQSFETYSDSTIAELERQLRWTLPEAYRHFLEQVGRSELFLDEYQLGAVFHSPDEVLEASRRIWEAEDEADRTADRFCFIGAETGLGDYFGYVMNRPGPRNFDVFCHEYPPFEYVATSDELDSWRTFEDWLVQMVQSCGEDRL